MLALLGVMGGCAVTNEPGDGTDEAVDNVVLVRAGGLGFCPSPNQFIDVSFARNESRALLLDGTVFRSYVPGECTADCLVTEEVGPLSVSDADATELSELAEAMRTTLEAERAIYGSCAGERDPGCDPCVVGELVIDGVSHSIDSCVESPCRLYHERLAELESFIDGLAPPPG